MSIAEKFEVIADSVYDKGKQDEWSDFWDVYQKEGIRTNYGGAFGIYTSDHVTYWNDEIYKPKYDMKPKILDRAYRGAKITDFKAIHESLRTMFDTSECTNFAFAFADSTITHIPELSCVSAYDLNYSFSVASKLHTIDKIIVKDNGTNVFTSTFNKAYALENVRFEGAIGNSISFSDCSLLSADSLVDIIKHLVDFSGTPNAGTRILSIHATAWENLNGTYTTPEEVGIPFFGSWLSYLESIGWDM